MRVLMSFMQFCAPMSLSDFAIQASLFKSLPCFCNWSLLLLWCCETRANESFCWTAIMVRNGLRWLPFSVSAAHKMWRDATGMNAHPALSCTAFIIFLTFFFVSGIDSIWWWLGSEQSSGPFDSEGIRRNSTKRPMQVSASVMEEKEGQIIIRWTLDWA